MKHELKIQNCNRGTLNHLAALTSDGGSCSGPEPEDPGCNQRAQRRHHDGTDPIRKLLLFC